MIIVIRLIPELAGVDMTINIKTIVDLHALDDLFVNKKMFDSKLL